jgi:hypothetical protein
LNTAPRCRIGVDANDEGLSSDLEDPPRRHSVRGTLASRQRSSEERAGAQDDPGIAKSRVPARTCVTHLADVRDSRLFLTETLIEPIQITNEVAEGIATAIRQADLTAADQREQAQKQAENRRRIVVSKIDRGYEDFVSGRISETFWSRKSAEWEAELQTVDAERGRLERTQAPAVATAEKILELATKAEILYKSQNPGEQRRLLETVLSNCTFDRGTLSPTYTSPFDLLVKGNETGNWRVRWVSN